MSASGALIRVLRVDRRITALILNETRPPNHLTIDSKAANPMKYTRWGRVFVE